MSGLYEHIAKLHQENAIHIRKGFHLRDATVADCTNHLLEEMVEAQAEILAIPRTSRMAATGLTFSMDGSIREEYDDVVEELGDTLSVFYHLLVRLGLSIEDVEEMALQKLHRSFTSDPKEVTAIKAGVTRKGRAKQ